MTVEVPRECECIVRDARIVLQERRSKITFVNADHRTVRKILIDGCVIKDGLRCDWLLINEREEERYIELKGADVGRALNQIQATISRVGANGNGRKAFVVSTRFPKETTGIQMSRLRLKKRHSADLLIRTHDHEEPI